MNSTAGSSRSCATAASAAPVEQLLEAGVERGYVLDALDHASARLQQAVLVVDHVPAGRLRPGRDLADPSRDFPGLRGVVETGQEDEAVAAKLRDLRVGQDPVRVHDRHIDASPSAGASRNWRNLALSALLGISELRHGRV